MARSNLTRDQHGTWELRRAVNGVELRVRPYGEEGVLFEVVRGVECRRAYLGRGSYERAQDEAMRLGYEIEGWEARNWLVDEIEEAWGIKVSGTLRAMKRELRAVQALVELD